MSQPERKLATPASLALDAVLVIAVFAFLTNILRPHVPSNDPFQIWLWAAIGASCLTGVFWLCMQMFRVTLKAQREQQKKYPPPRPIAPPSRSGVVKTGAPPCPTSPH